MNNTHYALLNEENKPFAIINKAAITSAKQLREKIAIAIGEEMGEEFTEENIKLSPKDYESIQKAYNDNAFEFTVSSEESGCDYSYKLFPTWEY